MEEHPNENRTSFPWNTLLLLVLAGAVILCAIRIYRLSSELNVVRNELSIQLSSVREDVNAISANVDARLRAQGSLFSRLEYTLGALDSEADTVPLTLSLIPKTVTEGMKLSVSLGEETASFRRDGELYTAELSIPLFWDGDAHPLLTVRSGETVQTEYLDGLYLGGLYTQFLPSLNASFDGQSTCYDTELAVNGRITLKQFGENVPFVSFTRVVEKNGREIERKDITSRIEGPYTDFPISERFDMTREDELRIYIVAEDARGYLHEVMPFDWHLQHGAEAYAVNAGENIYSPDGELLSGSERTRK